MEDLKCTKENVNNCAFSSWYSTFKSHTIRSLIIPLASEDVDYLRADGLVMPEGCDAPVYAGEDRSDDDSDNEKWEHDESYDTAAAPKLPNLVNNIKRSISSLGGEVFPKCSWSAPRDAQWMSFNGTLRCQTAYDVFLLLKTSDFVTHDLTQPYKDCSDSDDVDEVAGSYELVLRKWRTVIPGMEFRCFVKSHTLVGACQRDASAFYEHLREQHKTKDSSDGDYPAFVEHLRGDLTSEIQQFFQQNISGKFPDPDYVVDIYRRAENTFWVIDFNPFSPTTDSLLFTWDELARLKPCDDDDDSPSEVVNPDDEPSAAAEAAPTASNSSPFEFRINSSQGLQPSPFLSNRLPKDIIDLSSGEDINKFVDLFETSNLGGSHGEG
eukprot:scpid18248/ scgid20749/ Cell division cycle protein 123 homolog